MEDIKKAIEEESKKNYRGSFNSDSIWLQDQSFKAGANFILSKWQDSERWRKVEEELPELKDQDYFILCKTNKSQKYSIVLVHCELDFKRYFRVFEITHWKPIH